MYIVQCTSTLHDDQTPNDQTNTHLVTVILGHYISDRLTDSRIHSLIHSRTAHSTVSHSDTQRHTRTHWQIDTATNTVLYSLIDQLGLVNDRQLLTEYRIVYSILYRTINYITEYVVCSFYFPHCQAVLYEATL